MINHVIQNLLGLKFLSTVPTKTAKSPNRTKASTHVLKCAKQNSRITSRGDFIFLRKNSVLLTQTYVPGLYPFSESPFLWQRKNQVTI